MRKTKIVLPYFLIIGCSLSLFGCATKEEEKKSIVFHIGEQNQEVFMINHSFKVDDVSQDHKRFMGWSTDETKRNIIFDDLEIKEEDVIDYFIDCNSIDLFAIYADVLNVSFVLETTTTFALDSELNNKEIVPNPTKDGSVFKGWSLVKEGTDVVLDNVSTISYSMISPIVNGAFDISFYPVYVSIPTSNIKLYQYSTAEQMAEIHIETQNHLAIDDKSLIKADEHKGKDGELPVYDYVKATISVNHCEEQYILDNISGKVKVRGNYTSSYDKKPIRIKFDSKQKMLGLNKNNALKNWVLLASWKDTSLLRDASAFYLGNALTESEGYYCSDFRFVKVYLNDAYNGVYLLVEQQEISSNRINIPESKNANDTFKTGYFLEFDGYYKNEPDIQKFTISYNNVKTGNNGFTVSNDIMNETQHTFVKKVTQNTWNVVYDALKKSHTNLTTSPYHTIDDNGEYIVDNTILTAKEAVSRVIDIDSLVNMYILHEISEDRDVGFSSFYFALDFSETGNKKLTYTAPWDFDYSMGNNTWETAMKANLNTTKLVNDGRMTSNRRKLTKTASLTKEDFTFTNKDKLYCMTTDNPWFVVFANEQWFYDMVYARWQEAQMMGVFDSLLEMIDTMTTKYEEAYNENFTKWSQSLGITLSGYQPELVKYFVTQKQASQYLRIWLEARLEGLNTALKKKATV